MSKINNFEDLIVWQKSHELVLEIYKLAITLPSDEKYGIISQIKRSAVSTAANIAEGHSRGSRKDYTRFLYMAKGSLNETMYYLRLVKDLDMITNDVYNGIRSRGIEIGRILTRLIDSLEVPNP